VRIALDTNVLAYAEGVGDDNRCSAARWLVERLPIERVLLPAQTLGELYRVLTGKRAMDVYVVRAAILSWVDVFEVADSTWTAFQAAFDLSADHHLQIWDALILAVAVEHRCRMLVSEDLHSGFTRGGVTVVNPFEEPRAPLLESVLAGT